MEYTGTLDTFLWAVVGLAASLMTAFLILGWLKGLFWEKEMRFKRRHTHRFN